MPILDVQLIGPVAEADRGTLAGRIADAAGAVFASRPQQTWVTYRRQNGRCGSRGTGSGRGRTWYFGATPIGRWLT